MWRAALISLTAASMLTACACGAPPTPAAARTLPADLALECPALPMPASGRLPDLLINHVESAELYTDCRERHRATVEWVERGHPAQEP